MTTGRSSQTHRYIRSVQRYLGMLEDLVRELECQVPEMRPHDARSELLEQIHVAGALEQRRLFELLDQRAISHTWIGAQVAAEYLEMWPAADGRNWYRVTERAVRELRLGQLASSATFTSDSGLAFAEDWDSEEDTVYDGL